MELSTLLRSELFLVLFTQTVLHLSALPVQSLFQFPVRAFHVLQCSPSIVRRALCLKRDRNQTTLMSQWPSLPSKTISSVTIGRSCAFLTCLDLLGWDYFVPVPRMNFGLVKKRLLLFLLQESTS